MQVDLEALPSSVFTASAECTRYITDYDVQRQRYPNNDQRAPLFQSFYYVARSFTRLFIVCTETRDLLVPYLTNRKTNLMSKPIARYWI